MKTRIKLPDNLREEAEKTGIIPAGYYSRSITGAYENQYIHLYWEGTEDSQFTYWEEETPIIDGEYELW